MRHEDTHAAIFIQPESTVNPLRTAKLRLEDRRDKPFNLLSGEAVSLIWRNNYAYTLNNTSKHHQTESLSESLLLSSSESTSLLFLWSLFWRAFFLCSRTTAKFIVIFICYCSDKFFTLALWAGFSCTALRFWDYNFNYSPKERAAAGFFNIEFRTWRTGGFIIYY